MSPEIVLPAMWFVWWISWMAAAAWSDRAVKRPPQGSQIVYRLLAAAGVILLFDGNINTEGVLWHTPLALAWVMVVISCGGLLLTWWARIHLGRLWSGSVGRKANHRVVDTGPYGIVRHPIYSGITLASIATAAVRGTLVAWLGVVVMTLGWYVKARMEEEFLREELGAEAYRAYATRVPMLVPLPRRSKTAPR